MTLRRSLLLLLVGLFPLLLILGACDSRLEKTPDSEITPGTFFQSEKDFLAAASGAYSQLRGLQGGPLNAVEHSSDWLMVPTRGPDWGDGGVWRDLTQHEWGTTHPDFGEAWNALSIGIARSNQVISTLRASAQNGSPISQEKMDQFNAEMRFLRAYYYYFLMDMFGGVPIVVEQGSDRDFPTQPVPADDPPPRNTRAEVFNFILQELAGQECTAQSFNISSCVENPSGIIATLPTKSEVPFGRATQAAGYGLMARLLLNAEIFTGEASAQGITPGTSMYEEAAAAAEVVINSGRYRLAEDFFRNWHADNFDSPEIIFAATYASEPSVGWVLTMSMLSNNHPHPSTPWNGWTTVAQFYKSHAMKPGPDGEIGTQDDQHLDRRGKGYLVGDQYLAPSSGCVADNCFSDPDSEPVPNGAGDPMDFELEIPSIKLSGDAAALEEPGARPLKWEIDPAATDLNLGNDQPLIRLAEMYLIKAEAENELGNMNEALEALNKVHTRAANDPVPMPSSKMKMHQLISEERGHEFAWELLRRQDLIRYEFAHGGQPVGFEDSADPDAEVYAPTYTGPWQFKEEGSEGFRALFPIPQSQLNTNPNLTQNPGY